MADMIKLRKEMKSKKPAFDREDSYKRKEVSTSWRKPRGSQSKMRRKEKGYNKSPNMGYRSPNSVRGLSPEGLLPVLVNTISMLESIDKEKEGVVIAATVGTRKKVEIVKKAKELGLNILNIKNVDDYLSQIDKKLEEKKAKKAETAKVKEEKAKEKEKAAKEKEEKEKEEGLADKVESEEDKAAKEVDKEKKAKEEKDKLLTKRD